MESQLNQFSISDWVLYIYSESETYLIFTRKIRNKKHVKPCFATHATHISYPFNLKSFNMEKRNTFLIIDTNHTTLRKITC